MFHKIVNSRYGDVFVLDADIIVVDSKMEDGERIKLVDEDVQYAVSTKETTYGMPVTKEINCLDIYDSEQVTWSSIDDMVYQSLGMHKDRYIVVFDGKTYKCSKLIGRTIRQEAYLIIEEELIEVVKRSGIIM